MRIHRHRQLLAMVLLPAAALLANAQNAAPAPGAIYSFPRASHIVIDGLLDDWAGKGFYIEQLAPDHPNSEASDHAAWARIAWTRDDLLVAVRVWDDAILPPTAENIAATATLSDGDSILVQFALPGQESQPVTADLGPAPTPDATGPQAQCCPAAQPRVAAFAPLPDGYGFEAAFPWKTLGIEPHKNLQIGFQLSVRDLDPSESCDCLTWRLLNSTADDQVAASRLRISTRASAPCGLCIWEQQSATDQIQLVVQAPAHHDGDAIAVRIGDTQLANSKFAALPGGLVCEARLNLPKLEDVSNRSLLDIAIGEEPILHYRLRSVASAN